MDRPARQTRTPADRQRVRSLRAFVRDAARPLLGGLYSVSRILAWVAVWALATAALPLVLAGLGIAWVVDLHRRRERARLRPVELGYRFHEMPATREPPRPYVARRRCSAWRDADYVPSWAEPLARPARGVRR